MKSLHTTNRFNRCLALFSAISLGVISIEAAQQEEAFQLDPYPKSEVFGFGEMEGHLHVGWDTRYVSEGRDNLDGDSLFVLNLELGGKYFYGGIWYGFSPDQEYDELQLNLGIQKTIGDFEGYVGWTNVRNPFENVSDNEISAGLAYGGLPWDLSVSLDAYYSLNANGSFWELSLSREFKITDKWELSSMLIYGVNQGYISDGHHGGNHIALRCESSYSLNACWDVLCHCDYSVALGEDDDLEGDELLRDTLHAGISLRYSF